MKFPWLTPRLGRGPAGASSLAPALGGAAVASLTWAAGCQGLSTAVTGPEMVPVAAGSGPAVVRRGLDGTVRTSDGRPAAGVRVRVFVVPGPGYVASGSPTVYGETDGAGRFHFEDPPEGLLSLEAVRSADSKVFRAHVSFQQGMAVNLGDLDLQRTGTITGSLAWAAPFGSPLGADVYIPGTSYRSKADGAGRFVVSGVAAGSFTLVAAMPGKGRATLPDLTVRPGETVDVGPLELSVASPVLGRADPTNAAAGETVTLSGQGFGASLDLPIGVRFGGLRAQVVSRASDREIAVRVPAGARTGEIVVDVDGRASNPLPFVVIGTLALERPFIGLLADSTADPRLTAFDTGGLPIARPHVLWQVDGSAVKVERGLVKGTAPGRATVKAACGFLATAAEVHVVAGPVISVQGPAAVRVGSLWGPSATVSAFNLMADGSTNSYVTYAVSELSSFSVSSTGLLTPLDARANGQASLYLRSSLDPSRVATATIDLWNFARVETLAGGGAEGYQDGPGSQARFSGLAGIVADSSHTLYAVEAQASRIRRIGPDRVVSTLAGSGSPGFADGQGTAAAFNLPMALAMGPDGNLYVADKGNRRIRRVTPGGLVSTLAGNGQPGFVDGPGPEASFFNPYRLTVDSAGNLYVLDGYLSAGYYVRAVGRDGHVSTIMGGPAMIFDGDRYLSRLSSPDGFAWNPDRHIYLADVTAGESPWLRRLDSTGAVSTFLAPARGFGASSEISGLIKSIASDALGNLYLFGSSILKVGPDRTAVTIVGSRASGFLDGAGSEALLGPVVFGAVGTDGTFYVADQVNNAIRRIVR